ncbi:lipoprotein [Geomonas silvestris]|uniref:Lipoprotein n=1 Tax=Geomonas silvestris TaxID=2740184 RepID=A0A6V8MM84_9BACT|nr:hypothetical protein [Geomonas silvestris]GFO60853.1 lipoprotein [Geomonas silvestris]
MRSFLKLALLVAVTVSMFGCAHNYYNIPQETLEKKVKTVGVASLFTDADSDLRHPDKSSLVALIQTFNAKNEKELTARLRGTGTFYSVRPVDGDPNRLFSTLLQNRERREDAGVIYNKYFYKKDEVRRLAAENNLDALLLVVVNGITRPEKVYASNLLSYLETDYNFLAMSAQLVDRDGEIIWEYPNFKKSMPLSYPMLLSLQYPDFDEAAANLSDKVDVKFKTIAGITKSLAKTEKSVSNGPPVSSVYADQFDDIISLMKKYQPLFGGKKETAPAAAPTGALEPAHPAAPASAAPAPAAAPAPVAPQPPAVQEAPAPAPQGIQEPGMREEIVPETPAK